MKFRNTLIGASLLALAMASGSAWSATTLRLSTLDKPGSDGATAVERLAQRVQERTDGRVVIKVYPASQLGDWVEVHDQVATGAVDMAMQPLSSTSDRRLAIGWFPYMFPTYEAVEKATSQGGFVHNVVDEIIAEQGMTLLGIFGVGMGGAGFSKAVNDPANPDAKHNMKVRVWPGGITHRHMMERFGFSAATIPWAELFTGMQTGVVDGQIGGTAEMTYDNLKEVTKTWLQYNDHFECNWIFVNTNSLNKLDEADRKILMDAAQETTRERFEQLKVRDAEHLERLRDFGIEIVTFSDEELENFARVVRADVWPKISDELGDDIYARLRKEVGAD